MRFQLPLILESHATLGTLVWLDALMRGAIVIKEPALGAESHPTRATVVPLALLPPVDDDFFGQDNIIAILRVLLTGLVVEHHVKVVFMRADILNHGRTGLPGRLARCVNNDLLGLLGWLEFPQLVSGLFGVIVDLSVDLLMIVVCRYYVRRQHGHLII